MVIAILQETGMQVDWFTAQRHGEIKYTIKIILKPYVLTITYQMPKEAGRFSEMLTDEPQMNKRA